MKMIVVLPNNYVELKQEEMMYLDRRLYIDNHQLRDIVLFNLRFLISSVLFISKIATKIAHTLIQNKAIEFSVLKILGTGIPYGISMGLDSI